MPPSDFPGRSPGQVAAQEILDHMLEGCQILDYEWRYVYLNDAAVAHARRPREELLGRRLQDVYPGVEASPLFTCLARCMTERVAERFANDFVYPDGSAAHFELSVVPVEHGLLISSVDVTERRHHEDRTRRANHLLAAQTRIHQATARVRDEVELLHSICAAAVDGSVLRLAWIGQVTADGALRVVAAAGAAAGDLTGRYLSTSSASHSLLRSVLAEGTVQRRGAALGDPALSPFESEGMGSAAILPLILDDEVVGVLGLHAGSEDLRHEDNDVLLTEIGRDVALAIELTRRETERRVAERERSVRLARRGVRTAIHQMQKQGDWPEVVRQLGEEMTGLLEFERLGVNLVDEVSGTVHYAHFVRGSIDVLQERAERIHPTLLEVLRSGTWQQRRRGEEGFPRNIEGHVQAVVDVPFDGGTIAINTSRREVSQDEIALLQQFAQVMGEASRRLHDLRDLEQAQRQLAQAQKMEAVGRLAGGVAHDFNNLLTVICGNTELLLADGPGQEERDALQMIYDAGEQATSLTSQLLAFSRRQVLQPEVLDLNRVIRRTEKMLRRLLGEDIDLVTALDAGLHHVLCDPGQIEQITINLAVNARDAMPRGGKLTIETANVVLEEGYALHHPEAQTGPHAMLAVSDTGEGMDEETLSRVFEPFFTTKEPGQGTGLGLATVYGIVRQSGGTVWVYSEPGQGTTFKVYLPRTEGTVEADAVTEPLPLGGTETILVVEDHSAVREVLVAALRSAGYHVLEASGGDGALDLCQHHDGPLDLLLTDVVMPGRSGQEVATRARQLRPGIRLAFMSGYSDAAVERSGRLAPDATFIQKPVRSRDLLRKVRDALTAPLPGAFEENG